MKSEIAEILLTCVYRFCHNGGSLTQLLKEVKLSAHYALNVPQKIFKDKKTPMPYLGEYINAIYFL